MLNIEKIVQECDATMKNSSTTARLIKKIVHICGDKYKYLNKRVNKIEILININKQKYDKAVKNKF